MATYYVGAGGNDGNAGTSWAQRKLTLNGAEDIPVAAGDTVYVGPGVYRELLTCDVSGSSGSLISYIGDYTGANTDGVGGVVRITGSDNDQTATRASCITASGKSYRTFSGFSFELCSSSMLSFTGTHSNITVEKCYFNPTNSNHVFISDTPTNITIQDCVFRNRHNASCIQVYSGSDKSDSAIAIQRNIFRGGKYGVLVDNVGGIVINNCVITGTGNNCVRITSALAEGQTVGVYNSFIGMSYYGLTATTLGELVEDYNNIWGNEGGDRSNVATGANSVAYPPLFDTRWFFEMVNGGSMVTPWDLASYSQLVNVAGSSPPAADMRGTTIIGAAREWGPLEYDPDLDIEAGSGVAGTPKRAYYFLRHR